MARCYLLAMDIATYHAFNRFGLGRRPGEPVPQKPKTWLREQLRAPDPAPLQGLPRTDEALAVVLDQRQERQAQKQAAAPPPAGQAPAEKPHPLGQLQQREVQALLANALMTQAGFRERLVWFWANHFSVSSRGQVAAACAGAYVREAIRPYVTARFADMLLAVMRHPAMLAYLDQAESVGPGSVVGVRRNRGLNENLARESLELHTVSPQAGYSQADVTNYAKILTGWSIEVRTEPRGFRYRPFVHEPGVIEVFGRSWPEGEAGGLALLGFLGTHPATYRHIATKLVRHFVADDPPAADVARIETVLQSTGGDLGAASDALIDLPGAWVPGAKLRSPQDFTIACLRALGVTQDQVPHLGGILARLGQGVFQAPFPIGWPDRAADWAGPEAMLQRVDAAYGFAARNGALDPEQVGDSTLGPLLTQGTRSQIRGAGSRRDGMTLLLGSPEFARR